MTWDQKGHIMVTESSHWSLQSFILILFINLPRFVFKSDLFLCEKQRPKTYQRAAVLQFKPKAYVLHKPVYFPVLSLLPPPLEHEDAAMLNSQNQNISGSLSKIQQHCFKALNRGTAGIQLSAQGKQCNQSYENKKEKVFTYLCLTAAKGSVVFQEYFSDKFPDTVQTS